MMLQADKPLILVNIFPVFYRAKRTAGIAKMNLPTYLFIDFIPVGIIYETDYASVFDQPPNTC